MNLFFKNLGFVVVVLLASACGKNISGLSTQLTDIQGSESVETSPEILKLNEDVYLAEVQIQDVETEIQRLNSISPTRIKLSDLKNIIKNFKKYVDQIVSSIDQLEQKIQEQISKLDPNDPNQKKLIDRLQQALDSLEKLKDKLQFIEESVKNVLIKFFEKLEQKLDQYQGSPFMNLVLKMLLQVLEDQIIGLLP